MSLLDSLLSQVGGDSLKELSRSIGSDEGSTQKAVGAALPMLLGALTKSAKSENGAAALSAALERDHDGGILDDLSGYFQGKASGKAADGQGILQHLLGSKQSALESGLSKSTGVDQGSIAKLLPQLAPLVMGALGQQKKQGGLDVNGLMGMLSGEADEIEKKAPGMGGLLGSLLDQDGDGDVDLSDAAKGLLGRLKR